MIQSWSLRPHWPKPSQTKKQSSSSCREDFKTFLRRRLFFFHRLHVDSALTLVGWQMSKSLQIVFRRAQVVATSTSHCAVRGRFSRWNLGLLRVIKDPNFSEKSGVQHRTALCSSTFVNFTKYWNKELHVAAQQASFHLAMANMHAMYAHEMSVTLRTLKVTDISCA